MFRYVCSVLWCSHINYCFRPYSNQRLRSRVLVFSLISTSDANLCRDKCYFILQWSVKCELVCLWNVFVVLKTHREIGILYRPKLYLFLVLVFWLELLPNSCRWGIITVVRPSKQRMKKVWSASVYFLSWWPEHFFTQQEFVKRWSCYCSP